MSTDQTPSMPLQGTTTISQCTGSLPAFPSAPVTLEPPTHDNDTDQDEIEQLSIPKDRQAKLLYFIQDYSGANLTEASDQTHKGKYYGDTYIPEYLKSDIYSAILSTGSQAPDTRSIKSAEAFRDKITSIIHTNDNTPQKVDTTKDFPSGASVITCLSLLSREGKGQPEKFQEWIKQHYELDSLKDDFEIVFAPSVGKLLSISKATNEELIRPELDRDDHNAAISREWNGFLVDECLESQSETDQDHVHIFWPKEELQMEMPCGFVRIIVPNRKRR